MAGISLKDGMPVFIFAGKTQERFTFANDSFGSNPYLNLYLLHGKTTRNQGLKYRICF